MNNTHFFSSGKIRALFWLLWGVSLIIAGNVFATRFRNVHAEKNMYQAELFRNNILTDEEGDLLPYETKLAHLQGILHDIGLDKEKMGVPSFGREVRSVYSQFLINIERMVVRDEDDTIEIEYHFSADSVFQLMSFLQASERSGAHWIINQLSFSISSFEPPIRGVFVVGFNGE